MKLLALSGLIPEQICDIVRFTGYAGERVTPHYCGYAEDYVSMVKQDGTVDGAVFPKSCDSSRIMASYLEGCGKFLYQLNIPARQDDLAVDFFAAELKEYRKAVKQRFQQPAGCLAERTEAVNARNRAIGGVYKELEGISYREYLDSLHDMLTKPLMEQTVRQDFTGKTPTQKRVYLVGSFLANTELAGVIEDCGMTVVGDNLPESGRLAAAPVIAPGDDPYRAIAAGMLRGRLSPTQDNFRNILTADMDEIEKKNVNGVVFVTQKYCEPYDYLFPVYRKMLEAKNIAVTKIVLSDSADVRKAGLALEAFADTLA